MGFWDWISLLLEFDHIRAFLAKEKCIANIYGFQMHWDYLYYHILLLLVI